MTLKHLFGVLAVFWILYWLAAALTIGSLMGDSIPQLLFFIGMAFLPPLLLFVLFFRVVPRIAKRFKRPAA